MGLETGTYINSLVVTNPVGTDDIQQGDNHIRLIKSTIKNTFPNLTGAVTATHTELNYVDGVTSSIQTQIDNINPSDFSTGDKIVMFQASAPTGWTQDTTQNNKALRVVSGAGGGTGGTHGLDSPPSTSHNHGDNFAVAAHTLSNARIPSHSHTVPTGNSGCCATSFQPTSFFSGASPANTGNAGSGGSHNHGLNGNVSSGSITAFAPQYINVIVVTKD